MSRMQSSYLLGSPDGGHHRSRTRTRAAGYPERADSAFHDILMRRVAPQ
jgi:hypothetical protein